MIGELSSRSADVGQGYARGVSNQHLALTLCEVKKLGGFPKAVKVGWETSRFYSVCCT